jgi:hypothetical protein
VVSNGAALAFDVSGVAGGWLPVTEDGVRSAIVAELGKYFRVVSVVVTPGGSAYEVLEWPFRATVNVVTMTGYANQTDAASVVAGAVYDATLHMPTVGALGTQEDPRTADDGGGFLDPVLDPIKDLVSGIQGEFNLVLLAVGIVAVVLVVKLGGKTTRVGVAL